MARGGASPDWAMIGGPNGDGTVGIWASNELTQAELAVEYEERELGPEHGFRRFEQGAATVTMTAVGRSVTIVTGATYNEAFARLFATWSPEPGRSGQIESARPALERAP